MNKKIFLLTAGFGEGHNSAARGIRDGLQRVAPGVKAEIHDIFQETYRAANQLVCRSYLSVINRAPQFWETMYRLIDHRESGHYRVSLRWLFLAEWRLKRLIARERPDVVVGVYPAYGHMLDTIYGRAHGSAPRRVVLITDSITVNAIWFRCSADRFLLANEQTAAVLRQSGVASNAMQVTGFPVDPRFADASRNTPRAPGPPWRILCLLNIRPEPAVSLMRALSKREDVQLTVLIGRDERLRRAMKSVAGESRDKLKVVGWTNELPTLFHDHHLIISKAGGATVQEAIAAQCPMIINQIVPGQEEGNARLITSTGSGVLALSHDEVLSVLNRALSNGGRLLQEWRVNMANVSRPDAALRIAEFLVAL